MNSSIAEAKPSNRTPITAMLLGAARARGRLLLHRGLHRVLDVLDLVELDIDELAADLLDPADVNRLDHVARLGVDRDRAARALPRHALDRVYQLSALGVAVGLLQRRIDRVHAR